MPQVSGSRWYGSNGRGMPAIVLCTRREGRIRLKQPTRLWTVRACTVLFGLGGSAAAGFVYHFRTYNQMLCNLLHASSIDRVVNAWYNQAQRNQEQRQFVGVCSQQQLDWFAGWGRVDFSLLHHPVRRVWQPFVCTINYRSKPNDWCHRSPVPRPRYT